MWITNVFVGKPRSDTFDEVNEGKDDIPANFWHAWHILPPQWAACEEQSKPAADWTVVAVAVSFWQLLQQLLLSKPGCACWTVPGVQSQTCQSRCILTPTPAHSLRHPSPSSSGRACACSIKWMRRGSQCHFSYKASVPFKDIPARIFHFTGN